MSNKDQDDLAAVARFVEAARLALSIWRDPDRPGDRVLAGHDTLDMIDNAIRELDQLRDTLTVELRRDALARDARVDELLAKFSAHEIANAGNSGPGGPFRPAAPSAPSDATTEIRPARDFWGNPS